MTEEMKPAAFWTRAGAYFIDGAILLAVFTLLVLLMVLGAPGIIYKGATLIIPLVYFVWYPVAHEGQTPGKRIAGIKIISTRGGLTYGWAALRYFGYFLSGLPAGLGFVGALATRNRVTLHDYIAGTRVVEAEGVSDLRRKSVMAAGMLPPGLLLIAALIGMISPAVAPPPIESMSTLGNLLTLRAAKSEHYTNEGRHPKRLEDLTPYFLKTIPQVTLPGSEPTRKVTPYGAEICTGSETPGDTVDPAKIQGAGGWGYIRAPKSPCHGFVFIDSRDLDPDGRPWYTH
jgi:uncharacterized RDD family membrane protein YckC